MDQFEWKNAKPKKKTQVEKRNERKMKNSYFTQQYDAYGENFSNFHTSEDIKRDTFKIFRALADGAIDLEKHIKCFEDPTFLHILKDTAYQKMMIHNATQLGLANFINVYSSQNIPIDGYIYEAYAQHQRSTECYNLLYQAFTNIQITHDYVAVLSTLMPLLNKYKFSL